MIEYNSLTVAFQVDLYTVCDRFTPDLRMLSHIGHSQIDEDDFKLLFGRNTDVANDYYRTLHEINHSCLYDSIRQALKQNFELLLINCNRGDVPVYKFADSMNNLVLCGKAPYVIAVETPEELSAEDKHELLIRVCKTINDELSRFEVRTGSSAFLEDVCIY